MIAPPMFSTSTGSPEELAIIEDCSFTQEFLFGQPAGSGISGDPLLFHYQGFQFEVQKSSFVYTFKNELKSAHAYVAKVTQQPHNSDIDEFYQRKSLSPIIKIYMIDPTSVKNFSQVPSIGPFYDMLKKEFDENLSMIIPKLMWESYRVIRDHVKLTKNSFNERDKCEKKMGKIEKKAQKKMRKIEKKAQKKMRKINEKVIKINEKSRS